MITMSLTTSKNETCVTCENCGQLITDMETAYETATGHLCAECREMYYLICEDCGQLVETDTITVTQDGHYVCAACLENNYCYCNSCNAYAPVDVMYEARDSNGNSEYICECCRDYYYEECEDCGELYHRSDLNDTGNNTYRYVCDDCYNQNYDTCSDCGEVHHIDHLHWCERDDCYYCDDCYPEHDGIIQSYHSGHRDGLNFFGTGPLYFGIELEVEATRDDYDNKEIAQIFIDEVGERYWHVESDGSLDNGCEFISQPMSINFLEYEHKEDIVTALKKISDIGARSHDTPHCGLHFHVSRAALTGQDILNLVVLCNKFKDIIFKLSRRTEENFSRWSAAYDDLRLRDRDFTNYIKQHGTVSNRYMMVNLTNCHTVEFRFFRGTLNPNSFFAALNFIDYLINTAKEFDNESDIYELTNSAFLAGARAYTNELATYIAERGL